MQRNNGRRVRALYVVGFVAACGAAVLLGMASSRVSAQGSRGTATRPSTAPRSGQAVFAAHCATCHGATGRGDGPAAAFLDPRPRDFSAGKYKVRTTETGSIPADGDLVRAVQLGLNGTAMPGWDTLLPAEEIQAVVGYLKTLSPRFASETPHVVSVAQAVAPSAESIARGQDVYATLRCRSCHGIDGRGTEAITADLLDDWEQPVRATNLTEPWTFRGGATARDVYLRLRTGMSGTPMPSFSDAVGGAELWDLANYVVSLARRPIWAMSADEVKTLYAQQSEERKVDPIARGRHLVETLGCPICHSPIDKDRRALPGLRLAGGMLMRIEPFGDYPTGNLTSDRETGLGNWSDDQIKRATTRGVLPDGTRLLPYPMDWASYSTLTPSDQDAIVAFLRSVPPVSNRVPKPTAKALPAYLWGKFKMLVLGGDPPIIFFPGNVGSAAARGGRS